MMNTKNLCKIIVLVGPKHSGKSTVGKKFASLLDADFLDLDSCIEEQTGKSPRTLYKEGVDVFRSAELKTLQTIFEGALNDTSMTVLATGGGIIDNAEAAILLKEKSIIINLEVSAATAWKRIIETSKISGELPSFLQTDNPEETHRELHERRSIAYKQFAAATVNADDMNIKTIAKQIQSQLRVMHHSCLSSNFPD
ncbi:MAG: shikimate kinase [Treponema sp.]|jgi:shikimate kinase|nr:shikimate kinase [Treponema sp.]